MTPLSASGAALPRWGWRIPERAFAILTSVRFALWLIAFLAAGALLGVVFPQMPAFVRGDAAQREIWLAQQAKRYGRFTSLLDELQLFEVFRSYWFNAGLAVLLISVSVCTINRFPPIWRSIVRPQRRVTDAYFERARYRASFETACSEGALIAAFRKRRYRVTAESGQQATYLYADRFAWARLGTFATHLALLVFIASGIVTWRMSYEQDVFLTEGRTAAVKEPGDSEHMQVKSLGFQRETNADGADTDYRTDLVVYRDGEEVAHGSSTVNNPLEYDGYRFHQIAYSDDGAALTVRDDATGRLLYDEVPHLIARLPAPLVRVENEHGTAIFEDYLAPTAFTSDNVSETLLTLPDGRQYWVATKMEQPAAGAETQPPFSMGVLGQDGRLIRLTFGASGRVDDLRFSFASLSATKYATVDSFPGQEQALIQTLRHVDGTTEMVIVPRSGEAVHLSEGIPLSVAGKTYSFAGTRSFSLIRVRKDPGTALIWVASGLLLAGLGMTFYLPRRRVWARLSADGVQLAGMADRGVHLERELASIAAAAGLNPDSTAVQGKEGR